MDDNEIGSVRSALTNRLMIAQNTDIWASDAGGHLAGRLRPR
jgi:hypothetical protein